MRTRGVRGEDGVAMIMALMVVLVMTTIVLAVAQMTIGEVETHRMSRWDTQAVYLAHAGLEHQMYNLKANKDAGAISDTNYPVLPGETAGFGALWYRTTLTCTLNCTGNPSSRQWRIESYGEVRRYSGSWTTLQQRTIRAQVQIVYVTCGAGTYACPDDVTFLRWEEVYP